MNMMKLLAWFSYPSWSIACRVATAMMLAVIVPMTILAYFNLQQITSVTTISEHHQLELLASNAAQRVDRLLIDRQELATAVSRRSDVLKFLAAPKSAAPISPQLAQILAAHPDVEAILLLDRDGNCLAATMDRFVGGHYTLPETTIFSLLHSNVRDDPGMFVTQSMNSLSRERSGLVLLKLEGVKIWSEVNRDLPPKTAGQFFLVDSQGTTIGHQNVSLLYQKRFADWLKTIELGSAGHVDDRTPGQMPETIGFATLATQPWLLGVSRSAAEFQAPLLETIWLNLRELMAVGGIAALVAVSVGIYISRPIHALTIAVTSLEQGDDDLFEQIDRDLGYFAKSPDDLGQLVRAFLKMTDELHRRDRQLKTQVQSLRIEIDRTRRDEEVAEIVYSDRFGLLQQKIQQMRTQERQVAVTETDYFQQLQQQVQSLKKMGKADDLSTPQNN
jgi:hypothetical protein